MKIGICGAQSTGKTTLLNTLREGGWLSSYTYCVESTREIQRLGLNINEKGDDITQKMIMQHHVFNLSMYDDMITDRTVYDCMVYTDYLYHRNQISEEMYRLIVKIFERFHNAYDIIFYIKPEFDIVEDGVRSNNRLFRDEIDDRFQQLLRDVPPNNLFILSGTVDERIQQLLTKVTTGI